MVYLRSSSYLPPPTSPPYICPVSPLYLPCISLHLPTSPFITIEHPEYFSRGWYLPRSPKPYIYIYLP